MNQAKAEEPRKCFSAKEYVCPLCASVEYLYEYGRYDTIML